MRSLALWLHKYGLYILLTIIALLLVYGIFIGIDNNKLKEQNTQLKEKVSSLETEVAAKEDLILERNNEIYILKMERDEWKELFYAEIDFHPYEGPEW